MAELKLSSNAQGKSILSKFIFGDLVAPLSPRMVPEHVLCMTRRAPRSGKAILNKTEEACPPGWMGLSDPIIEAIKQEKTASREDDT